MLPARMIRLRGLAGLPSADEDLAAEVDEEPEEEEPEVDEEPEDEEEEAEVDEEPEDEEEEAEEGATWVTWRLELSDNT